MDSCSRDAMDAAEFFQAEREVLVWPQPQGEGATVGLSAAPRRRQRPEQLEIRLRIRRRGEERAVEAEGVDLEGLGDRGLLGQDVAAVVAAILLCPQRVAVKERRAIARAERHGRGGEPRDAVRPIGLAVERGMLWRLRQRRHHIGERTERRAPEAGNAAGEALLGKSLAYTLQLRLTGLHCERESAATRFYPLNPLGHRRTGLTDLTHYASALLVREIEQATRLELVAHQPLRDLAIAGFRQAFPEKEPLRHLVARQLGGEIARHVTFARDCDALTCDTDGNADLAPHRIGHAYHGDLADTGMRQDFLLDLARIDVGAAGDVHVGGAAGDVDEALLVHVAEIAGPKPAVAKRLGVGCGIVVVAGKHGRPDHADLAGLEWLDLAPGIVLDLHLHAGALVAAAADACLRPVLLLVQRCRQHRVVAGDLAEAEILHDRLAA